MVTNRVNREPAGLGEHIYMQDRDNFFRGWGGVIATVTPLNAWGVISHLEASNFSRPGDAPVLVGLGMSGIPAGAPGTSDLYSRAFQQSNLTGNAWDVNAQNYAQAPTTPPPSDTGEPLPEGWSYQTLANGVRIPVGGSDSPTMGPAVAPPEDAGASLWGIAKGVSRWAFDMFNIIPEGIDAVGRAAVQVSRGVLTPAEAIGGMFGIDRDAFQLTGIPVFGYLRAAWEGERLNMGTGLFSEGEFAPDVLEQMALYDEETNSFTQGDFNNLRDLMGGKVVVPGPQGTGMEARDLAEWKFLRNGLGRAANLSAILPTSAQQAALGMPVGAMQEQIFDQATMARQTEALGGNPFTVGTGTLVANAAQLHAPAPGAKTGNVFSAARGLLSHTYLGDHSPTTAQTSFDPSAAAWHIMSSATDFSKQMVDLRMLTGVGALSKGVSGVSHVLSGAGKFISNAGEAGDLARGSTTLLRIVDGADEAAKTAALTDLTRGTLNRDLAVNAVARGSDEPLRLANITVEQLRRQGLNQAADRLSRLDPSQEIAMATRKETEKLTRKQLQEVRQAYLDANNVRYQNEIDRLINRAAEGDYAATAWARKTLDSIGDPNANVPLALRNLTDVSARDGVKLTDGIYGRAVVADDMFEAANKEVDDLQRLFDDRKAWVIRDPETGKAMLTFDADLGDAGNTLETLVDTKMAQRGSRLAAARRAVRAYDDFHEAEATYKATASEAEHQGLIQVVGAEQAALRMAEEPMWPGGISGFHGSGGELDELLTLEEAADAGIGATPSDLLFGPGFYSTSNPLVTTTMHYGGSEGGTISQLRWTGEAPPNVLYMDGNFNRAQAKAFLEGIRTVRDRMLVPRSGIEPGLDEGEEIVEYSRGSQALNELEHALQTIADGGKADELKAILARPLEDWDEHVAHYLGIYRTYKHTPADVYRYMQTLIRAAGGNIVADIGWEFDRAMANFNEGLKAAGVDALHYKGGDRMGGMGPHDAFNWLRPEMLEARSVTPTMWERLTRTKRTGYVTSKTGRRRIELAEMRASNRAAELEETLNTLRESGVLDDVLLSETTPMLGGGDELAEGIVDNLDDFDRIGTVLKGGESEGLEKLRRIARQGDPDADKMRAGLARDLMREHYATTIHAKRLMGGTDLGDERVENLIRVLLRSDGEGLVSKGVSGVAPKLDPNRLTQMFSGGGRVADLFSALADAKTIRSIMAILGPTVEFSGKIPAPIVRALRDANTTDEVADVFLKMASGQHIISPRMALLGNAARYGSLGTALGLGAGGVAGAYNEYDQGGGLFDIVGGGITGAILGAFGGSALTSLPLGLAGKATRSVESVADGMDLMLAGTRAMTTDFITKGGLGRNAVEMSRAHAGLSVPAQLGYAYGHSAFGRRIARSTSNNMNLNDPNDMFYSMSDYARALGVETDDVVDVYRKGVGDQLETARLVRSEYDSDEAYNAAKAEMEAKGFTHSVTYDMDEVLGRAADLTPNNAFDGYRILRDFGRVADAKLEVRGLHEDYRGLLTHFAKNSSDEFLGTLDAMGRPVGHMQLALNRRITDVSQTARLESEMWNGRIQLPSSMRVQRAVNQTDKLGRVTQLMTGRHAFKQIRANMRRLSGGDKWIPVTPELEHNVAMRTMRQLTGTLWAPLVLLGRPFAFISRVLMEDQARMAAANLDNMFTHPINYVGALMSDFDFWQQTGVLRSHVRGIASRSLIPDELFDPVARRVNMTELDNMSEWEMAESIRHALNIYDRTQARHARMFGTSSWTMIEKGQPQYLEGLATEFRQLITDPMVRHMAGSKAGDPIGDTIAWLNDSTEGQKVFHQWLGQFEDPLDAAEFTQGDALRGFLHDEYARLHLKTGGDWVFKNGDGTFITSAGMSVSPEDAAKKGWDKLDTGYIIFRKGDKDLMNIVATGHMRNVKLIDEHGVEFTQEALRVNDKTTEQTWGAIKDILSEKNTRWKGQLGRLDPNLDDISAQHSFPAMVKGVRSPKQQRQAQQGALELWDDGIDRFYDFVLGRPTKWLSRQPVIGNHYWERIGMLYGSMDDGMRATYKAIAEKEGTWKYVKQISDVYDDAGATARGSLDNIHIIDLNAKAYAVERTRDILFDLHRQRNFIDGFRIIAPFMGPFIESMEAWTRVLAQNPIKVWRRGGQLVQSAWNSTGVGSDHTGFLDPLAQATGSENGWFYTDPETGDEMFQYPILSHYLPAWLNKGGVPGVPDQDLEGRARGLNVMFGAEDLSQGEGPEFLGFPVSGFSPGAGPILQMTVAPFLRDKEGMANELYKTLFPFGTPENPFSLLPYNLRKFFEGNLGEQSASDLLHSTSRQIGASTAAGEAGMGPQFKFDLSTSTGSDEWQAEMRQRGIHQNWFEALMRTILPTVTTPEVMVELAQVPGLDQEKLVTLDSLAREGRDLLDLDNNGTWKWLQTADGYQVSTEGDPEAVTAYLNQKYGLDMFSAEFLSLPITHTVYPRSMTEEGMNWVNDHPEVMGELNATGGFLMPDYAQVESSNKFSYEARDAAIRRGDTTFTTYDEQRINMQSRLLKMANSKIERDADAIYGSDATLAEIEDDTQRTSRRNQKAFYISQEKERAAATYEAADTPESEREKVFKELVGWDRVEWGDYEDTLTDEELATVNAMLWYLQARATALAIVAPGVNSLDDKGDSEDEQRVMTALRQDMRNLVDAQFAQAAKTGLDMGNFGYLYEKYLKPEIEPEEEFDALGALAEARRQDIAGQLALTGG